MIYFKNLQTGKIIEFQDENSIGSYFYDTNFYIPATQSEIDNHLFNKKKEELIAYCKQQRDLRKSTFKIIYSGQEYIINNIDECFDTVKEMIGQVSKHPFPRSLLNNKDLSVVFTFQNLQQAQYIYTELICAKVPNYENNYFNNVILINACTTLAELEALEFTFVDLVINL